MARKKQHSHPNHERWLVSYADFITLLFAFFVVMYATSQVDKSKAKAVSESVKDALNGESFKSVVNVILGGTVNDKGQGNALRKGPGGVMPKNSSSGPSDDAIVDLLPLLSKQLE